MTNSLRVVWIAEDVVCNVDGPLSVVVYLSERGHGQQRVVCKGVVSEIWRSIQRLYLAHLPFRTAEETARVTRAHPHHPPGHKQEV